MSENTTPIIPEEQKAAPQAPNPETNSGTTALTKVDAMYALREALDKVDSSKQDTLYPLLQSLLSSITAKTESEVNAFITELADELETDQATIHGIIGSLAIKNQKGLNKLMQNPLFIPVTPSETQSQPEPTQQSQPEPAQPEPTIMAQDQASSTSETIAEDNSAQIDNSETAVDSNRTDPALSSAIDIYLEMLEKELKPNTSYLQRTLRTKYRLSVGSARAKKLFEAAKENVEKFCMGLTQDLRKVTGKYEKPIFRILEVLTAKSNVDFLAQESKNEARELIYFTLQKFLLDLTTNKLSTKDSITALRTLKGDISKLIINSNFDLEIALLAELDKILEILEELNPADPKPDNPNSPAAAAANQVLVDQDNFTDANPQTTSVPDSSITEIDDLPVQVEDEQAESAVPTDNSTKSTEHTNSSTSEFEPYTEAPRSNGRTAESRYTPEEIEQIKINNLANEIHASIHAKKWEEVIALISEILKTKVLDRIFYLTNLGVAYYETKDYGKAKEIFKNISSTDPNDYYSNYYSLACSFVLKDYNACISESSDLFKIPYVPSDIKQKANYLLFQSLIASNSANHEEIFRLYAHVLTDTQKNDPELQKSFKKFINENNYTDRAVLQNITSTGIKNALIDYFKATTDLSKNSVQLEYLLALGNTDLLNDALRHANWLKIFGYIFENYYPAIRYDLIDEVYIRITSSRDTECIYVVIDLLKNYNGKLTEIQKSTLKDLLKELKENLSYEMTPVRKNDVDTILGTDSTASASTRLLDDDDDFWADIDSVKEPDLQDLLDKPVDELTDAEIDLLYAEANRLYSDKNYATAIHFFKKLVQTARYKNDTRINFCIGYCLLRSKNSMDNFDALPYFYKILDYNPNDTDSLTNVAFIFYKIGYFEAAKEKYKQVLQIRESRGDNENELKPFRQSIFNCAVKLNSPQEVIEVFDDILTTEQRSIKNNFLDYQRAKNKLAIQNRQKESADKLRKWKDKAFAGLKDLVSKESKLEDNLKDEIQEKIDDGLSKPDITKFIIETLDNRTKDALQTYVDNPKSLRNKIISTPWLRRSIKIGSPIVSLLAGGFTSSLVGPGIGYLVGASMYSGLTYYTDDTFTKLGIADKDAYKLEDEEKASIETELLKINLTEENAADLVFAAVQKQIDTQKAKVDKFQRYKSLKLAVIPALTAINYAFPMVYSVIGVPAAQGLYKWYKKPKSALGETKIKKLEDKSKKSKSETDKTDKDDVESDITNDGFDTDNE